MKKLLFLIVCFLTGMVSVSAKEINIYFYPKGGSVSTSGFELTEYGYLYYGDHYYAKYTDKDTIKNINSISGVKFSLTKNGSSLVKGREWYFKNYYDGKIYFINESKSYKASDILKVLANDDTFYSIDLYANWSGSKISGTDLTSSVVSKVEAIKIKKNSKLSKLEVYDKVQLEVTTSSGKEVSEEITYLSSKNSVARATPKGRIIGINPGEAIITAKTASGKKATVKVTVVKRKKNIVGIVFHANGGTVKKHSDIQVGNDGTIYFDTEVQPIKIDYGSKLNADGLINYNNKNYLYVTKSGYIVESGKEWNTKPDGSGKSYSQSKVYKASDFCDASKGNCSVHLYVNWQKIIAQTSMNLYKDSYYNLNKLVTDQKASVEWSSENTKIVTVTKKGVIKGITTGATNIVAKMGSNIAKIKINVRNRTNDKDYSMKKCSKMNVKVTDKPVTDSSAHELKNIKLEECISDVQFIKPGTDGVENQMQSISVSDKYIYYSSPLNGGWLELKKGNLYNTDDATTKKITTIFIMRVPRTGKNTMEYMRIEYAGHGQGLDTAGLNQEGNEILYVNLASTLNNYTQEASWDTVRGTHYRGIGVTTFDGGVKTSVLRHPGIVISILANKDNTIVSKTTSQFQTKGVLNESAYYDYLKSTSNKADYIKNPQASVDEVHKRVAVKTGKIVMIYDETQFRNGKGTPLYKFQVEDTGDQGNELYGNYFYTVSGSSNAVIKKYDITKKSGENLVAQAHIDFTEYLKNNGYIAMEPEGLSFNKGQLYAAIVTFPCVKHNEIKCTKKTRYNTIVKVSGI